MRALESAEPRRGIKQVHPPSRVLAADAVAVDARGRGRGRRGVVVVVDDFSRRVQYRVPEEPRRSEGPFIPRRRRPRLRARLRGELRVRHRAAAAAAAAATVAVLPIELLRGPARAAGEAVSAPGRIRRELRGGRRRVRVQVAVRGERRRVVHLDQPRLVALVEHDVEPQDFETSTRGLALVVRAAGALRAHRAVVRVREVRLYRQYRLHDERLDLSPERPDVAPAQHEVVERRAQRSLRALVVVLRVHERVRVLVQGVVRQVHRVVIHVEFRRLLVLRRRQPHEAFLVDVHRERVHARHERVHPHVELVPVQQ
eukprot:29565-Pelagococcus_subviridis.AAC.7